MITVNDLSEYAEDIRRESDEISVTDSFLIACEMIKIEDFRLCNGVSGNPADEMTSLEKIAEQIEAIKNTQLIK